MEAQRGRVGELRSWRVGDYAKSTEGTDVNAFGHLLALSLERIKELREV
jgi:hypothetical protein